MTKIRMRERIQELEAELELVKADRAKFRIYFLGKFRWFISLLGEKSSPNMAWLVEDCAKFATSVERWYWG